MLPVRRAGSTKRFNPLKIQKPVLTQLSRSKISFSSSFRLKTLEPIDLTKENAFANDDNLIYTVKLLSNWGDPQYMCCSYMQFLSHDRRPLNPIKMMSAPKLEEGVLQKLNGDMVKEEANQWRINWPPDEDDIMSIIFMFQKHQKPCFIRLWNPQTNMKQSIKDIEIYNGENLVAKEEIPKGFGKDIQISVKEEYAIKPSESMQYLQTLFPQLAPSLSPCDLFGQYPSFKLRKVSFEILKNYGNEKVFGLSQILFLNDKKAIITRDEINRITVDNCSDFTDPLALIPTNRDFPEKCQFVAHSSFERHPMLTFYFEQTVILSKIIVKNLDFGPSGFDCEVNHMRVFVNDRCKWIGKVQCTRLKEGVKPPPCVIHVLPSFIVSHGQ